MSWVWAALGKALSKGKGNGKGYGNQKQGQKFNKHHTTIKPSDLKKAIQELQKAPPPPPQHVAWKCKHCGAAHHNKDKLTCRRCRKPREEPKGPQQLTQSAAPQATPAPSAESPAASSPVHPPLLQSSILQDSAFLQATATNGIPIARLNPAAQQEVGPEDGDVQMAPGPAESVASLPHQEAATQLNKYKIHYSALLESLGEEDSTVKDLKRKIVALEAKISDLGMAKDQQSVAQILVRLEKERTTQAEAYSRWDQQHADRMKELVQALEEHKQLGRDMSARVESHQKWLENSIMACKAQLAKAQPPAAPPPPSTVSPMEPLPTSPFTDLLPPSSITALKDVLSSAMSAGPTGLVEPIQVQRLGLAMIKAIFPQSSDGQQQQQQQQQMPTGSVTTAAPAGQKREGESITDLEAAEAGKKTDADV